MRVKNIKNRKYNESRIILLSIFKIPFKPYIPTVAPKHTSITLLIYLLLVARIILKKMKAMPMPIGADERRVFIIFSFRFVNLPPIINNPRQNQPVSSKMFHAEILGVTV